MASCQHGCLHVHGSTEAQLARSKRRFDTPKNDSLNKARWHAKACARCCTQNEQFWQYFFAKICQKYLKTYDLCGMSWCNLSELLMIFHSFNTVVFHKQGASTFFSIPPRRFDSQAAPRGTWFRALPDYLPRFCRHAERRCFAQSPSLSPRRQ